jgi:diacylglycerol kinase (ATP)
MRAVAILGPNARPSDVARFEHAALDTHITLAESPQPGFDATLVFGGDGTLHRHLAKLVELQVPLLVVANGSGNDFARSLGLHNSRDAIKAWEQFCRGAANVRSVDLGLITQEDSSSKEGPTFFCCIGGTGLDSQANRRANRLSPTLRARGGYLVSALIEIARWKPVHITVSSATATVSEPATFVAFANAPTYGDGMKMAPRALLDDGLLDVCFVRRTSKCRLLTFFPTVFFGRHLGLREVEYFQACCLKIETERPMDVYADGEYVCQTPTTVRVEPRALRVIQAAEEGFFLGRARL